MDGSEERLLSFLRIGQHVANSTRTCYEKNFPTIMIAAHSLLPSRKQHHATLNLPIIQLL